MGDLQQILDNGYGVVLIRTDEKNYAAVAVAPDSISRPLRPYLDYRLRNPVQEGETAPQAISALADYLFCTPTKYRAARPRVD